MKLFVQFAVPIVVIALMLLIQGCIPLAVGYLVGKDAARDRERDRAEKTVYVYPDGQKVVVHKE